jgi:hypothetical protein
MKEVNKDILQKAMDQLPESDPEPWLWNKIEAFLDFDQKISETSQALQEFEPKENQWDHIEAQLDSGNRKIIPLYRLVTYSLATAASILIVFFAINRFFPTHKEHVTISYSTEIKTLINNLPKTAKTELDSENFIKMCCSRNPDRCESPEISSLKYELENLNHQYSLLNSVAEQYGNDENILKAYSKIETARSRVIKELVSKLKS